RWRSRTSGRSSRSIQRTRRSECRRVAWYSIAGSATLACMQAGSISPRRLVALLPADWRRRPAYRALADSVRRLVLDRRLPPGARLPGERSLAQALAVSRTTVSEAYARLRAEGF